jgi:hypothetical protein
MFTLGSSKSDQENDLLGCTKINHTFLDQKLNTPDRAATPKTSPKLPSFSSTSPLHPLSSPPPAPRRAPEPPPPGPPTMLPARFLKLSLLRRLAAARAAEAPPPLKTRYGYLVSRSCLPRDAGPCPSRATCLC